MANKIYQARFLGIGADIENITASNLCASSGIINENNQPIANIRQISIEGAPGMVFFLNGIQAVIGSTGVYEVFFNEPDGRGLYFSAASIQNLREQNQRIKEYNDLNPPTGKRPYTPLTVNVVYDE